MRMFTNGVTIAPHHDWSAFSDSEIDDILEGLVCLEMVKLRESPLKAQLFEEMERRQKKETE